MLNSICPKLPMRNQQSTLNYYVNQLGFTYKAYEDYLMVARENIEIHFFRFENLNPLENYGQVYIRTDNIDKLYESLNSMNLPIHPNGKLSDKPWGQREFSLLDPDNNLLTFGQAII